MAKQVMAPGGQIPEFGEGFLIETPGIEPGEHVVLQLLPTVGPVELTLTPGIAIFEDRADFGLNSAKLTATAWAIVRTPSRPRDDAVRR